MVYMKTLSKVLGIIAVTAVIGMFVTGCTDPNAPNGGTPQSSGENAVSGKTYYESTERTVFSNTAEGDKNGNYTVSRTVYR
jgi:hypothetical protein